MMPQKICPTCHRKYSQIDNYCSKCGIKLTKEPNRCSAGKTALCKEKVFEDDDKYCSICGAPTTFFKDLIEELDRW